MIQVPAAAVLSGKIQAVEKPVLKEDWHKSLGLFGQ
jgi:hypothetical protein